ncbi:hypothetical protein PRZ48_015133 [Zasmidium cellare]|uniref:Uncharacterized protein n=1 Tax=Zasmidium cellare TaxID=395010 RepID=A0ABR0DXQ6_ZASCE|nr:hypothetical protein PRZ48_015133 [Zasmidium cellare]
MPSIQRYEWLCLRALKPRQYRYYTTTTESSPQDQTPTDSPPPPPEPPKPTMGTTPDHIRTYLEQQDTAALNNLKTKLHTIQTNASTAESLLLSYQSTLASTQLIPSIPPYTAWSRSEARFAAANLQSRITNLQNNIWDLENIPYRYERGASSAQKYGEEMGKLVGKREVEAERTEMRNRVDVYRKRWAQKVEGLRGIVDEMRRGMGLGALARVGGGMGGTLGVVERERNPFEGVRGGNGEGAVEEPEPEVGTAKIEAEAEAVNPTTPRETVPESIDADADTVGTAKVEAEASEAQTSIENSTIPPTGYTPLKITHQPSGAPSDPEEATINALKRAATRRKSPSITEKRASGTKVKDPEPKLSSMERMNQLLSNLQADAAVKRGEVVDGGKGDVTEEKKGVDERRGNPFAR